MQKITPHLWFEKQALASTELYVSSLPGSKVTHVSTLSGTPSGDCEIVSFELAGQPFRAISAGPMFKLNPSISFQIRCRTTEEVDAIWTQLSPGGRVLMPLDTYPFSERYGWVEDKYGLSWQVMQTGGISPRQKLVPVFMFVGDVCGKTEEAINFYVSVFETGCKGSSRETNATVLARYGGGEEPEKEGSVRYAEFSLCGQEFAAMDSAREHNYKFNEAISLIVPCDTQEEIDYFWGKLSADPKSERCGWLKDKYGLSWQITPTVMQQLMSGEDKKRTTRVTQAFMNMKKLDIDALKRAAG